MTRRRLWAIPGLTGIALLLVLPLGPHAAFAVAGTAAGLNVTIATPADGQKLTSPGIKVTGEVETSAILANVDSVEVRFSYRGTRFSTAKACGPCGTETAVSYSVNSPAFDLNGPYSIDVAATGHVLLNGFGVDGGASRSFTVAVPPDPPTGVTATPQPDRSVKLTWTAPATPPDFLGYVVYRKIDAGGFSFLDVTKQTTYLDSQTSGIGGPVQYQVASVREGAVPGDSSTALQTRANAVATALPPLPTTSTTPGATTTTLPPGGGNQPDGAARVDLSGLIPSPAQLPQFPAASPPPTLPDAGYSPVLPFPTLPPTSTLGRVEGRQPGAVGASSGEGQVQSAGANTNRRALLVPVAAGSVLCVTALHLRWLNRRLAVPAALGTAAASAAANGRAHRRSGKAAARRPSPDPGTATGDAPRKATGKSPGKAPNKGPAKGARFRPAPTPPSRDLEPLPPEPDSFLPDAEPVRVGAGAGRGSASRLS